jgi:hypothetical protein
MEPVGDVPASADHLRLPPDTTMMNTGADPRPTSSTLPQPGSTPRQRGAHSRIRIDDILGVATWAPPLGGVPVWRNHRSS